MDISIVPHKLTGTVRAIPSKSQAHRLLICAAFSDKETFLRCPDTNRDIEATADCLRALGAQICRTDDGYLVTPALTFPEVATLNCAESGSTIRFMLPIVAALGVKTTFNMEGRLPYRPLSPLWEELERNGCHLSRPSESTILCDGRLNPGCYRIDGSVSSQFITGLLFAMALMKEPCTLEVTGKLESKPYIEMTKQTLALFGVRANGSSVNGCYPFTSPGHVDIEGDWSNAAFFLAAKKLNNSVTTTGLRSDSAQGDRAVEKILFGIDQMQIVDAADIPDLVPILAVVAGATTGATFMNIARLRLKESDRVTSVANMLRNLGCDVTVSQNELHVFPNAFQSCTIDACGDHRIAMAAAIAATVATGPVTIIGAQCVSKSYPSFWEEYRRLGGIYEQHIRQ